MTECIMTEDFWLDFCIIFRFEVSGYKEGDTVIYAHAIGNANDDNDANYSKIIFFIGDLNFMPSSRLVRDISAEINNYIRGEWP